MKENEKMIKIDTHLHSSGISQCSRVTYKSLIDQKIAQGYDGGVLTNHCHPSYYEPSCHAAFISRFLKEYECAAAYAKSQGFLLFLGLEATVLKPWYSDWLLFGLTPKLLERSPCFFRLDQERLFAYCEENGLVLVHAHPYRWGGKPCDERFMHGIEINCSSGDLELKDRILEVAKERELLVTCGTDFHGYNPFRGGMYVPEWVQSSVDFAKHLRSTPATHVFLEKTELEIPVPRGAWVKK